MIRYAVVVPTIGRANLDRLLRALSDEAGPAPEEIVVVNDRPSRPLVPQVPPALADRLRVVEGAGQGPAAARNVGWRAVSAPWVVFLDDDVVPGPGWRDRLAHDLARAGEGVAAVQARIRVPLPGGRRPTDWERQVAGLASAPWITADIAYRRDALAAVGGFDERFHRAYREDTDLALRVRAAGYTLVRGERETVHPVGAAGRWVSLGRQCGNADDAFLRRRYGRHWRRLAGAPPGRRRVHVVATLTAAATLSLLLARRPRPAVYAGLVWLGLTAEFAARRIAAGPRTRPEVTTMLVTSALIPPSATWHWLRGWVRHRRVTP